MKIFLYAISFIWVAAGACFILYTGESRGFLKQMFDELNEKILSAAAMVIGLLLLFSASEASHSWFIILLGLLGLIKGGLLLANPQNIFEAVKSWSLNTATDQTYRFFGIVMLVIGTAVFSWV